VAASSPSPVLVGRGRQGSQWDAGRLDRDRALEALLAAVHWAGPGGLAAAGCLGGAAVHRQLLQFQTEQLVIGSQHLQAESFGHPGADPLVPAAAQGGRRAGGVGDVAIPAAEHQHLDELVEDHPVSDAGPVAAERVTDLTGGQQRGDLDPEGVGCGNSDMACELLVRSMMAR
jgi:hypothetical protein